VYYAEGTMRKVMIVVMAIALVVWVVSWFRTPDAVATSGAKAWPEGMGALASVVDRLPPQNGNEASMKLMALAEALPKTEVVANFVTREITRGELTIGQPPTLPDLSAIRELLLREPVIWKRL